MINGGIYIGSRLHSLAAKSKEFGFYSSNNEKTLWMVLSWAVVQCRGTKGEKTVSEVR